ncbi:MAG: GFA family protein [Hyphomonadaceae bacterium]|nr:GFA family protein [Hyphomonadaceae bacterium]
MRPAIPEPPYEGGCLCGAVRYRIEARPIGVNACHCRDCQKLTGATNLVMAIFERAAFAKTQGETQVWRKRADSGREVDIERCAACGTRLWHEPLAAANLVYVAAGALDDPSWAVPASHIWVEKRLPHAFIQADAVQVEGQPAEREALFEAFRRLYPE